MKKILIIISGYFILIGFSTKSQQTDYLQYHRKFAQIEELITDENLNNFYKGRDIVPAIFELFYQHYHHYAA